MLQNAGEFHLSCSFSVDNRQASNNSTTTTPRHSSGLEVESYGTGTQVRLPGKSAMEPRVFKFGTPYFDMYRSLAATPEDEAFFLHNGVLQLCKRGASVKVSDTLLPRSRLPWAFLRTATLRSSIAGSHIYCNLNDSLLPNDGKTRRPPQCKSIML